MFERIRQLLLENGINLCAPIALANCTVRRPYLLERAEISDNGTAVMFAIPYHTPACEAAGRNCSRYAVGQDYHLFVKELSAVVCPVLQAEFPAFHFAMFADHAPIDERDAAARAGLGVLGDNGLLITASYSSYVFIGELITDAPPPKGLRAPSQPPHCEACGACRAVCPMIQGKSEVCLSALTQKKGNLTAKEQATLAAHGSVWGCDLCQEVCPHTKKALREGTITTPLPFFHDAPLPRLTYQAVGNMTKEDFAKRAYAWRGREVILRNLAITERNHEDQTCGGNCKKEGHT